MRKNKKETCWVQLVSEANVSVAQEKEVVARHLAGGGA